MHRFILGAAAAAVAVGLSAQSHAALITADFREGTHGEVITNKFLNQYGFTVSAVNVGGGPNKAAIFDSRKRNTPDPDLEGWNKFNNTGPEWSVGNLKGKNDLGKIMIIAENDVDANGDGFIDVPSDEGGRPSGTLTFTFNKPISEVGFNLIDIEAPSTYPAGTSFVALFRNNRQVGMVKWSQFITPGDPFFDSTVKYGNNSANRIKPIRASQFGQTAFDKVVFNFGWSDAMDALTFTVVPEPTTLAFVAAGIPMLLRRRERI